MIVIRRLVTLLPALFVLSLTLYSQDSVGVLKIGDVAKLLHEVNAKIDRFDAKVNTYTKNSIKKALRREKRLRALMCQKNSVLADKLFTYAIDSLQKLQTMLKSNTTNVNKYLYNTYLPHVDSLAQSLKFINQLPATKDAQKLIGLSASVQRIDELQDRLAKLEEIKQFFSDRRSILRKCLKDSPRFAKYLKGINKDAYYYAAQIEEYKSVLNNPTKVEEFVVKALLKIPSFKSFFQSNSQLAGLFAPWSGIPASGNVTLVNGIPGRLVVQQSIQSRLGTNISASQFVNQQIGGSISAMSTLKEKFNELRVGGTVGDLPDFKVNPARTKTFWQRLEYGFDVQVGKAVNMLPTTSDISLQLSYKLNAKSSIGIGAMYKLGVGSGWNNVRLSHQGIGFRSFLNFQLKATYYVQGGGELNHFAAFGTIDQLKVLSAWQPSAMVGLMKKYQISKKVKGNVQILYDILRKINMPETKAIVFRFGYSF